MSFALRPNFAPTSPLGEPLTDLAPRPHPLQGGERGEMGRGAIGSPAGAWGG